MDFLVRAVNAEVDNFASLQNIVRAFSDVGGVTHEGNRHPLVLDVVEQLNQARVEHRFAAPDIPDRGPALVDDLVHEVFIGFDRNFACFQVLERLPQKVTVVSPLPTGMTAEVTHVRNAEADELQRVASAVLCAEWVAQIETLLRHLVSNELAGSRPILREGSGKLIDEEPRRDSTS